MFRGLITAVRTLTTLPVPGRDAKDFSSALYFFPAVGALLGLITGGVCYLIDFHLGWKEMAAAAGLLVSVRATGCLHVDGLADVCDSFGGSTREKRLMIMKDSRVGVYGVVGVVLSLLFKYLCLVRLNGSEFLIVLPVVFALSRTAQVGVMVGMPYARETGTAESFVANSGFRHLIVAAALALVFVWCVAYQAALLPAAAAILITCLIRIWTRAALGGVTGDVIGFTNELVELAGLLILGVVFG